MTGFPEAPADFAIYGPSFLVISPPKTGSHWLAANLGCHPEIFIPTLKELKYFSSLFKWFDLDWYLGHFMPGLGRVKGEASPSYAFLPSDRIRFLHALLPDLKLIYLMRDPIARAWSHAKHNHRFGEANFAGTTSTLETVPASDWHANFVHDWPYASGDYVSHLQRWSAVFPRRQLFVGFHESIVTEPEALLRKLFVFLEVAVPRDLSAYPTRQKVFPGMEGLPAAGVKNFLHRLLYPRTAKLAAFLRKRFELTPPESWHTLALPAAGTPHASAPTEFDDRRLAQVLEQEATFPSPPLLIEEGYRGFNILFYRGRLHALKQSLGPVRPEEMDASFDDAKSERFRAGSMSEIRRRIDQSPCPV